MVNTSLRRQHDADISSVAARRPAVLVTQLGGELQCAMTRGWVDALRLATEVVTVTRIDYAALLGQSPDVIPLAAGLANPLAIMRLRAALRGRGFARVLSLDFSLTGRLLATVCPPHRRLRPLQARPSLPADVDALAATQFARLGVTAPLRTGPLTLSDRTRTRAAALLAGLGLAATSHPAMLAPRTGGDVTGSTRWQAVAAAQSDCLPVVLLPPGDELEVIGALGGRAYFIPAPPPALRAALLARAAVVIGNDAETLQLARLMHRPVLRLAD